MRPETGPMKFGEDWRGIFIRGDGALAEAQSLKEALRLWTLASGEKEPSHRERVLRIQLGGLVALLESVDERMPVEGLQHLRPFLVCQPCTVCYKGHYEDPSHYFVCTCLCHKEDQYGHPVVP